MNANMRPFVYIRSIIFIMIIILAFSQISALANINKPSITPSGVFISEFPDTSLTILDPASSYDPFSLGIVQELYEGLLTYDGNSLTKYRAGLAYLNYSISSDGLNYTFYLRSDVQFSDGSPFNAYVMQYSIQRAIIMNDPDSGVWIPQSVIRDGPRINKLVDVNITQANQFLANRSVVALNDNVISIYLEYPSSSFLPKIIFTACSAVSPSSIINYKPSNYSTDQNDDIFGMISLNNMFPNLDNNTIRTKLGLPLTSDVANSGIVPSSGINNPSSYLWNAVFNVGTGPYKLQSFNPGLDINLVKNNEWWNNDNFVENSPRTVRLLQVEDLETRINDLKNGDAVFVSIPKNDFNLVLDSSNLTPTSDTINVGIFDSLTVRMIAFNQRKDLGDSNIAQNSWSPTNQYNKTYIISNNILQYSWTNVTGGKQYASSGNPFTALLFRKAFALAFNYDMYLTKISNNLNFRSQGVIPKGLLGHQDDLIIQNYIPTQNLTIAKELFSQVNWKGNITFGYYSLNTGYMQSALTLKTIIDSLDVGINIILQPSDSYFSLVQSSVFTAGWSPDYADASDFVAPFLQSTGFFTSHYHYSNPYVDSLIVKADSTSDNTNRNILYREIEINASQDYPLIYLEQQTNALITSKIVTGTNLDISGSYNPMNFGLKYQYLGINPDLYPSTTEISGITTSTNQLTRTISDTFQFDVFATLLENIFSGLIIILSTGILISTIYMYRKSALKAKSLGDSNYSFKDFITRKKNEKPSLSDDTLVKLQEIIDENIEN